MKPHTIAAMIFSVLFMLSGCVMMDDRDDHRHPDRGYHKPGPPPHAPAHGYRYRHHDGHELEYDAEIGVYIVLRIPNTYFGNNMYIRMSSDGRWIVSESLDGGWRIADDHEIPYRLKEHKEKNKHKKHKKSHDDDD